MKHSYTPLSLRVQTAAVGIASILTCLVWSAEETPPPAGAPLAEQFKQLDRNGDEKLTRDEIRQLFDRLDANQDGVVTTDEIRISLGRAALAQRATPAIPANASFVQTEHRLTVDGRERTYIVQSPKQPRGKLPMVFLFHGGGGRGENLAAFGFREMVARKNFLAIYPTGWKNNWNDGRNASRIAAQQEGVDDVKFVRAIVDDLAVRHQIDRTRLFATGASNGGIFSHYLAVHAADLFAAVAPVIGGLAEPVAPLFKPSHPISLLVIQGDADPLVPIGGGPIARSNRGGRIIPTEEMLKLYLAHNGHTGKPTEKLMPDTDPDDGCRTLVRRYPAGNGGVKVEYWLVKGGGHTLPGNRRLQTTAKELLVGKTSRDHDGLEVIWNFFKSCPPREKP